MSSRSCVHSDQIAEGYQCDDGDDRPEPHRELIQERFPPVETVGQDGDPATVRGLVGDQLGNRLLHLIHPEAKLIVRLGQLVQLNVRSPSGGADRIFEGADPFTRPGELLPVYPCVVGECVADIPVRGINDIDSFRQVPQAELVAVCLFSDCVDLLGQALHCRITHCSYPICFLVTARACAFVITFLDPMYSHPMSPAGWIVSGSGRSPPSSSWSALRALTSACSGTGRSKA